MSVFRCDKDAPCREDLCCDKDGYCTKAAEACDVDAGCQGNCKVIPDPRKCATFKSTMFPNISATNTIPMAVGYKPVRPASCGNTYPIHALTPCELVEAMGGPDECPYCLYYYDYLREAAEMYDMAAADCTPSGKGSKRYADYLTQVGHETGSLTMMREWRDNGAGALHQIPVQWMRTIDAIPRYKSVWDSSLIFQGITQDMMSRIETNETLQRYVGLWLQWPENAFVYAGWQYPSGGDLLESPSGGPCGDLRLHADMGLGTWDKRTNKTTGFYQTSACIYGEVGEDWGFDARLERYKNVSTIVAEWAGAESTASSSSAVNSVIISVGAILALVAVGVAYALFLRWRKAMSRRRTISETESMQDLQSKVGTAIPSPVEPSSS